MKALDQPIAVGRTAEVFDWDAGSVLKLYRDWCPPDWVEHEARIARAVDQAGLPAPKPGEIIEVDGRRGILYEKVSGPSMLDALRQNPFKLAQYGRTLAQLHLEMHHTALTSGLPSQRAQLIRSIQAADALPDADRQAVLQKLDGLPDGDQLCHGDFHPGNVILTPRGPVVIDWMTANQGHPAADLARTRLLLTLGDPPSESGAGMRLILILGRNMFFNSYLRIYTQSEPQIMRLSDAFLPVLAAARLNENILPEREKLLKYVHSGG